MVKRLTNALRPKNPVLLGGVLVLLALLAAYANHFQNSFHFDDAHTVVNNAAIRELRNVPLFFRDATTFSALPSNQSYRPLVSTLLAFDYWLGGGLKPFFFHASIFAIFILLVFLLAFVLHRLLQAVAPSRHNEWIALAAAAAYGLHPANADTVNYVIASADLISTLGVVASFALYLGFPGLRRFYIYILPAAFAILAKPPAAVFALLFAIYRLLFPPRDTAEAREPRGAFAYFKEIIPSFLICAAILLLVQRMTPRTWVAGAADGRDYLRTQPYVGWLYFKTFLWPNALSADYDLNPFHPNGPRIPADVVAIGRFWVGLLFLALFAATTTAASILKQTRLIGFGLLWFVVALLPTSLLPLAEVMNDHRTFLPYVGLVVALAGAVALFLDGLGSWGRRGRIVLAGAAALLLCLSGYATFQRNKVWKTEESLWRDVTLKSPRNGRGLMNYGNTLMARGDYTDALSYFHRALIFTPQYPILFINLAIVEDAMRRDALAEQHFKEALRLAPLLPDSYTYYSRYLISHGRITEARALLQTSLALSPGDLAAQELMAQTENRSTVSPPSFRAEDYLNLSLLLYQQGRFPEAIDASRKALALRPDYAEAWNNIAAAFASMEKWDDAIQAAREALRLKPDFQLARNNLAWAEKERPKK